MLIRTVVAMLNQKAYSQVRKGITGQLIELIERLVKKVPAFIGNRKELLDFVKELG